MAVQHVDWENSGVLIQSRNTLKRELERTLRQYEARYELRSNKAESEMAAGRLPDTAETCDWVIAYRAYARLLQEANE